MEVLDGNSRHSQNRYDYNSGIPQSEPHGLENHDGIEMSEHRKIDTNNQYYPVSEGREGHQPLLDKNPYA